VIPLARPDLGGNEIAYVTDALKSGWISSRGSYVDRFEAEFSGFIGKPALTCTSGTAALHLALLACNLEPGDEVIVPDLTFAATAAAVVQVGAKPVLVDVDEDWLLSPAAVNRAMTKRTRAIIPVHLYGMACDMPGLNMFRHWRGLYVIEDCAESLGERYQGKRGEPHLGTFGDFACFSFYANKAMTTGEGGMVVGRDLDRVKLFRDGGFRRDGEYFHEVAGLNYRMTNLTAALGCAQLERFDQMYARRKQIVEMYRSRLNGRGTWFFVIDVDDPKAAGAKLKERGIETRPVFIPLHTMPPFRQSGEFPNATKAYERGLCLPTGPHLSDSQVEFIIEEVEAL
jgi:perosamine synthetase